MPILDTKTMDWREKRPGWRGAIFSSPSMTFAHWRFSKGAEIHQHDHEQEEVWHLMEGELEVVVDGAVSRVGPGAVIVLPAHTPHAVTALTDASHDQHRLSFEGARNDLFAVVVFAVFLECEQSKKCGLALLRDGFLEGFERRVGIAVFEIQAR